MVGAIMSHFGRPRGGQNDNNLLIELSRSFTNRQRSPLSTRFRCTFEAERKHSIAGTASEALIRELTRPGISEPVTPTRHE